MGKHWYSDLSDYVPSEQEIPIPSYDVAPAASALRVTDMMGAWQEAEDKPARAGDGMTFGWPQLDRSLGRPVTRGEVVVVGARTGVGKTWVAQHLVWRYLEESTDNTALIWSGEMPTFQIGERFAMHAAGAGAVDELRAGTFDRDAAMRAHPHLGRVTLCDSPCSVEQLRVACETSARRFQVWPTLLVVDYTGLLSWSGNKRASLYERASETARRLKVEAIDLDVIMLACVQLSRSAGDGTTEPTLDSLRDSGAAEEAADRIVLMWRDNLVDETEEHDGTRLFALLAKNRHGPISQRSVPLEYDDAMRLRQQWQPGALGDA